MWSNAEKKRIKELEKQVKALEARNERLLSIIEKQTERMIAISNPTAYAQYLADKNITQAERESREKLAKDKFDDIKGMEELGILTSGVKYA